MSSLTVGGLVPGGDDWIVKRLKALEDRVAQLTTQRMLESALINGTLTVDGTELVNGMLDVTGDATFGGDTAIGGTLTVSGPTELDATLTVAGGPIQSVNFVHNSAGFKLPQSGTPEFNDLILRGGIIGDDALTNPESPATGHNQLSTFSLSTTIAEKARITFTPPSGYSRALVIASTDIGARNSTGGQDYLTGYVDINGMNTGFNSNSDASPGFTTSVTNVATVLLTSLGSSFYVRSMAGTGIAGWASDPFNTLNVDALVLYLR